VKGGSSGMKDTRIAGGRVAGILLIEDDPDDAETTRRAFARAKIGNPITVVGSGEAALDLLTPRSDQRGQATIDLVLLDLGLPKLDGRGVLREIWADKRLRHIPIIVLTGSRREDDLIDAYKGGAVRFLQKPVDVGHLLIAIGDLYGFQLLIMRTPDGL